MTAEEMIKRIQEIENLLQGENFWADSKRAMQTMKELELLKNKRDGKDPKENFDCVVSIYAGTGGDDSEDFVSMLYAMYQKYAEKKGWQTREIDSNENSMGGFRSITFSVEGALSYAHLFYESGVHRLIRNSPFNAKGKRQTSFALVETIPLLEDSDEEIIDERDIQFEFTKAGGPGGQNVNKRETAVRATHIPTGLAVRASSERTQESNRKKAVLLLSGKLQKIKEERAGVESDSYKISDKIDNDWGSQMRTYTLHPYQLIKDHRSGFETANIKKILNEGDLDQIIESVKVPH